MSFETISPFAGSPDQWNSFVYARPEATGSHLFGWKRVVEDVYQHDCPYMIAQGPGGMTGVLPLVDVRSLAFGRYLVSMPFLNGGGPIGSRAAVAGLARSAAELARERNSRLLELRATDTLPVDMTYAAEKVGCVLDLPADPEQLWTAFSSKLRSQVRRPQKEGVEMRFGDDQLEPFFTVFARNMRDLGSPTHPRAFFEAARKHLGDAITFGCAYLKGVPVAGGCAVSWRGEVEMTWASALREYNAASPNMLLYWSFIERAIRAGATRFNFGRCTPDSGSHRFKRQWGTVDVPLFWYRSSSRADAAPPRQDAGSLSLASRVWQRMPVPVATAIGARLRGGIPA
jgi:FemAB-related protein (PEP-CTERM system-associated)